MRRRILCRSRILEPTGGRYVSLVGVGVGVGVSLNDHRKSIYNFVTKFEIAKLVLQWLNCNDRHDTLDIGATKA